MIRRFPLAIFTAVLCLFLGVSVSPAPTGLKFSDDAPPEVLAAALVTAMSDEDALAQVFMFGWRDIVDRPSILIQDWISERHIGAVKVFGWNTNDTIQLAQTIGAFQRQAAANPYGIPLLVATDQEGGFVRHVRGSTSITPGAMAIGAAGFPIDAYRCGYYIGRELAIVGINMNFAPTVDLYTNHDSTLIGSRSFGDSPQQAGIMGIAFARGLLAAGIIPTAKHFPGHGDTAQDSHGVLPTINAAFETLWERELVPYRMMAGEKIPAVMSGHLAFPNTESKNIPASLSPWFLTEVLRGKIGFEGLIITDDLMMNGASQSTGSLWRTAKQALLAGNDILMMNQTPELDDPVWNNLLYAMRTEENFKKRVREAATRVVTAKLRYLRGEKAVPLIPDLQKVRSELPDKAGAAFFQDLAARSVTIIKNEGGILPLDIAKAGTILIAFRTTAFRDLGKKAYNGAASYWYPNPNETGYDSSVLKLMPYARAADTIIFHLSKPEEIDVLRRLRGLNKRVIVISTLTPASFAEVPWVQAAVVLYNDSEESLRAGFSAVLGTITARGNVPFSLNDR